MAENKTNSCANSKLSMYEKFASLFLISMFTIFPIYLTDKLFNIRVDRLHFFIAALSVFAFFIFATYVCGIDTKIRPTNIFQISVTDISMLSFMLICTISAILSDYGKDAFTGAQGRDSGMILMCLYVLCYFLLSRYLSCKNIYFDIFTITSCIVCLLAVLNVFYIDPFNLIDCISAEQRKDFITTIGNINIFSSFVCVTLAMVTALFISSKSISEYFFYGLSLAVNFLGMIAANSDSGYFGLIAFISILFIFCCKDPDSLYKFFLSITIMLISGRVFGLISQYVFKYNMKELDPFPQILIYNENVDLVIGITLVLSITFFINRKETDNKDYPKLVQISAAVLVGLLALSVVSVFYYFSFVDKTTDLGALKKYLRLNDQWGTHRGYAWIRSISLFKNGGIKNMLVGTGPDTFGPVIKAIYREDMLKRHGSVFDNAHNEYLNYLVTIGIFGVVSYITAIISVIIRNIKHCKDNFCVVAVILIISSYCAQAIFNIATPIVTPYIFVFLGIAESYCRRFNISAVKSKS